MTSIRQTSGADPGTPEGLVGRIVAGRYQLVRLIGRGGMGAVYEAVQLELARRVAIKVLIARDESAIARFRQEALLVATIGHPNVVQVTDLLSDDDLPVAIVMELLEGESLATLLAHHGRLPEERAAAIARQMLAGLAAAHARDIVHRDVKPSNVLIMRTAHGPELVKVLDFGIAKSLDSGSHRTTMGVVIGTPAYMAPEQILGQAVDARTDVYAVGACLYEMLTGERTTGRSIGGEIPCAIVDLEPGHLVAAIGSRTIADVVEKALTKDPANRWADAHAMAVALAAASPSSSANAVEIQKARGPLSEPLPQPPDHAMAAATPLRAVRGSSREYSAPRAGREPHPPSGGGAKLPADLPIRFGDVLVSKYRVDELVGMGAMGVVVAATHLDLDQKVALKLLLPGAATSSTNVERFLREARAAVRLKSPHVARTLDTGRFENGGPYIVMEFLEGRDLDAELRSRGAPLSIQEAVSYVLQACDALSEAHSLGIVHRDLKPANLFLTRGHDGRPLVKVLDFGISKLVDTTAMHPSGTSLTRTEMVFGSPAYMSPEQIRSSKNVDGRSDIWSIGVILYELLTCQRPFEARTGLELALKIRQGEPTSAKAWRPDFPVPLERIIGRCLEKDPARRFANIAELASALTSFAHPRDTGSEVAISDSTQISLALEERGRDKLRMGVVLALATMVVLGVSVLALARSRSPKPVEVTHESTPSSSPAATASGASTSVPASSISVTVADAPPVTTAQPLVGLPSPEQTSKPKRTSAQPSSVASTARGSRPPAEPDAGRFFRVRE